MKWSGFDDDSNSWEPLRNIPACFHPPLRSHQKSKAKSKSKNKLLLKNVQEEGKAVVENEMVAASCLDYDVLRVGGGEFLQRMGEYSGGGAQGAVQRQLRLDFKRQKRRDAWSTGEWLERERKRKASLQKESWILWPEVESEMGEDVDKIASSSPEEGAEMQGGRPRTLQQHLAAEALTCALSRVQEVRFHT